MSRVENRDQLDPPSSSSSEETDHVHRSNKKVKNGHLDTLLNSPSSLSTVSVPLADPQSAPPPTLRSYKDAVSDKIPKEVYFDENVEIWSDNDEEEDDDMVDCQKSSCPDLNKSSEAPEAPYPIIVFPKSELQKMRKEWKDSLIIKLLGRTIGYKALCDRLKIIWKTQGNYKVIDLEDDFFLIKFDHKEDCNYVITSGPWVILNHYLTTRRWEPNFNTEKASNTTTAVWLRLPRLPPEYFKVKYVYQIAKRLGKPIKIDMSTASFNRGRYARVCVELDLSKPLEPLYGLADEVYRIEYEFIGQLCFACGKVGHRMELCREKPQAGYGAKTTAAARQNSSSSAKGGEPGNGNGKPGKSDGNNKAGNGADMTATGSAENNNGNVRPKRPNGKNSTDLDADFLGTPLAQHETIDVQFLNNTEYGPWMMAKPRFKKRINHQNFKTQDQLGPVQTQTQNRYQNLSTFKYSKPLNSNEKGKRKSRRDDLPDGISNNIKINNNSFDFSSTKVSSYSQAHTDKNKDKSRAPRKPANSDNFGVRPTTTTSSPSKSITSLPLSPYTPPPPTVHPSVLSNHPSSPFNPSHLLTPPPPSSPQPHFTPSLSPPLPPPSPSKNESSIVKLGGNSIPPKPPNIPLDVPHNVETQHIVPSPSGLSGNPDGPCAMEHQPSAHGNTSGNVCGQTTMATPGDISPNDAVGGGATESTSDDGMAF